LSTAWEQLVERRSNRRAEADWAHCVEAEQKQCKNKNILNFLATVIPRSIHDAVGHSEKGRAPCFKSNLKHLEHKYHKAFRLAKPARWLAAGMFIDFCW